MIGIILLKMGAFGTELALWLIGTLFLFFFAILFLQSGIDKVTDRKGNLEWLTGHFAKSPLAAMVPTLLSILTFTEIGAGALCIIGWLFFTVGVGGFLGTLPFFALAFCGINFLMLFLGQRMVKDYAGAAGIVPYFIANMAGMWFFLTIT